MNLTLSNSILTISLVGASLLPIVAAEPNADQLLMQMSARLASGKHFTFEATRQLDAALREGHDYIRTVPAGYTTVVYGGYTCMFVGGVYYRPVIYGGNTVYVVVH